MSRPFRFGFSLDGLDGPDEIAARARRAEDMGYSSVVMTDHFDNRHAPLVTMAAVALATNTLRVGTLVLANDYRHPAVLAKELASLDVISGGAWRSASEQDGWPPITNKRASSSTGPACALSGSTRRSPCWRAASATAPSTSRATTTGSPGSIRSPSRSRSPAHRCS
ncbi:MAG: LLM class flavin-dependent oxidoreductase [Acidimicrobiaceae bacterium]|nr:LLM class flavin-dependent oxidoreductase [Acidimicrobiaceae bacterium]MYE98275.1 LLM class flavin-dependent oxidoreductase [Acidimicrobiaceae bacterium]MYH00865.1 LLM class flavin-dependent oxidoreductase [Acidimicrobiaceae bacterium]MYI53079.1 LLM class flavin-dependent oxidoreductase [Acidimicrobiaceae bacterium]